MINVENITKSYQNKLVLKGISFEVKKNEIFGLLGPNGAGKTTTLECIEGLRTIDSGEIRLNEQSPEQAISTGIIGVQLQSSSLFSNITVKEAMELVCAWQNCDVRMDLLEEFHFKHQLNKKYKVCSTGEKRRLHLALALAHNPKILILDEPTAGLDVQARVLLHKKIKDLKTNGITMILASHDMAEVQDLCDRIGIIVQGKIIKIATVSEIINEVNRESMLSVQTDKSVASFSFINLTYYEHTKGYDVFKTDNLHQAMIELTKKLEQSNTVLLDLEVKKPTLEERFVEIANQEVV